ncbi:MAG: ABC transporter ATP-binding protein [Gammaproteobacteria bacterium]
MNAIDLHNISVTLKDRQALRNVNLAVARGRMLGLIGPNGAGKTTLLRALLKLVPIQGGSASLQGRSIEDWSAREIARTIAYLPQDHTVHWPLDARRVVELGRIPHLGAWDKPASRDALIVDEMMRQTETERFGHRSITTLSAGERARVMLARILATEAPIVLADEPVAALDPFHQLHVLELLANSAARGGTVIVVLHDLTLASRFCDELCLLDTGECVAQGSPDDVLSESRLAQTYRVGSVRGRHDGQQYVLPWTRESEDRRQRTESED